MRKRPDLEKKTADFWRKRARLLAPEAVKEIKAMFESHPAVKQLCKDQTKAELAALYLSEREREKEPPPAQHPASSDEPSRLDQLRRNIESKTETIRLLDGRVEALEQGLKLEKKTVQILRNEVGANWVRVEQGGNTIHALEKALVCTVRELDKQEQEVTRLRNQIDEEARG